MMKLIGVVVVCVIVRSTVATTWLESMLTPRGLELGGGLSMHLESHPGSAGNATWFDKHAVRVDYGGYGVRVGKERGKDGVQLGLVIKNNGEGRGKKGGNDMMLPLVLGFKMATVTTVAFTAVKFLVFKAIAVASLALIATVSLLVTVLFKKGGHHEGGGHHMPHHYGGWESNEHYPSFSSIGGNEGYPYPSGGGNMLPYHGYSSGTEAQSSNLYAAVATPPANATAPAAAVGAAVPQQTATVARRRDVARKKTFSYKPPVLTIHRS